CCSTDVLVGRDRRRCDDKQTWSTTMSETYSGRCLCGAVHFEAHRKPKWVRWCHCESCRRHSGAPANVFVSFENDAVTVKKGAIAKYSSSPGVERGFCAR